jgi:hypothetical protein
VSDEVRAVLAEKTTQEKLAALGFEVWPTSSPDEFARYASDQLAHWAMRCVQPACNRDKTLSSS